MIKFKTVKFKNFGSFGNYFTEVDFESGNMMLVSGPNGHGKSYALLDSITFALFGKPFRKINLPQLVNTINNKNCIVHLNFTIGEDEYEVIRGLKPKKFEIHKNGEMIKQNSKSKDYQQILEDQILKMNYKSFTQIVTLGSSSFIPFMQLTAADRREVIEDILNINIFSDMNIIIKAKISFIKTQLIQIQNSITILEEKINLQDINIKSLISKRSENISNISSKIDDTKNEIQNLLDEINDLQSSIEELETCEDEKRNIEKSISKLEDSIVGLIKDKRTVEKSIDFYEQNEQCSVCLQEISEKFKTEQKNSLTKNKNEYEEQIEKLKSNHVEFKNELSELTNKLKHVTQVNGLILEKKNSISAASKYITSLEENSKDQSSFDSSIMECEENKESYKKEIQELEDKLNGLKQKKSSLDVLFMLLKDSGIKAKIIKNYLPVINKIINKYLSDMNFFVSFSLDEQFNEEIKSRHRDTFSYMNFSEGEKSRIDLAILLAWREIAKIKNSAYCNILILDEIFDSSLDSVGVDDLMKVLRSLSKESKIFVITHKTDQLSDKFDRMLMFKKKNNFSRLLK